MRFSIAGFLLALVSAAAAADRLDHDAALEARARGEVKPLADVIKVARTFADGVIIRVELEREGSRHVYELTFLTTQRRKVSLSIDAKTLELIERDD